MNINAIENQTIHHQHSGKAQKSKESLPSAPEPVQAVSETPETENSAEGQKGVLRLLQEGHFKGVADVRLRINFHDEISAMENEQLRSVSVGETDTVINTVSDFLKSQDLTDEDLTALADAFMADAENAKADFLNEENPSIDNLINDLDAAFESLVNGLNGLIPGTAVDGSAPDLTEDIVETVIDVVEEEPVVSAPVEESPVAGVPIDDLPEEPVVTDEPSLETEENTAAQIALLVEELAPVYDAAVGGLKDTLSSSSVLRELSEPKGNGVAYEKFLSMYNDLYRLGADELPDPSFTVEA